MNAPIGSKSTAAENTAPAAAFVLILIPLWFMLIPEIGIIKPYLLETTNWAYSFSGKLYARVKVRVLSKEFHNAEHVLHEQFTKFSNTKMFEVMFLWISVTCCEVSKRKSGSNNVIFSKLAICIVGRIVRIKSDVSPAFGFVNFKEAIRKAPIGRKVALVGKIIPDVVLAASLMLKTPSTGNRIPAQGGTNIWSAPSAGTADCKTRVNDESDH